MDNYLLYTDSAADIPQSDYARYDIRIIPMDYSLNGKEMTFFTDSKDHDKDCDILYAAMREGADVHTSQITPFRYVEYWRPELEKGHDILYLCFSSGLSATWENALSAANMLKEEFPDRTVRVVDSLAGTAGQGVYTVTAAMNREKGMSLEENALWLEEHVKYLCHRFTVGDLDYLHKGGRVSAAVALIGGMLKIKPILIIDDEGKLQMVAKARGRLASFKTLVKSYKNQMGAPDVPGLVFIGHTSMYEDVEKLKEMILEVVPEGTRVEVMCETPIIGSHTGPDFFSVCGFGMHRKEE